MNLSICGLRDAFSIRCSQEKNHFSQNCELKSILDLIELIQECKFEFDKKDWEFVSTEAQDLINNLLKKNPQERLLPGQVLDHEWFREKMPHKSSYASENILSNLKKNKRRITKTASDLKKQLFNSNRDSRKSFNQNLQLMARKSLFRGSKDNFNLLAQKFDNLEILPKKISKTSFSSSSHLSDVSEEEQSEAMNQIKNARK